MNRARGKMIYKATFFSVTMAFIAMSMVVNVAEGRGAFEARPASAQIAQR